MAKQHSNHTTPDNQPKIVYEPDIDGMISLHCIQHMLFCLAQDDSAAKEMDAFTLLGISGILEDCISDIKKSYSQIDDELEALIKRHRKLRSDLAACAESLSFIDSSRVINILADDKREVSDAN